jgi:hypothetical protein
MKKNQFPFVVDIQAQSIRIEPEALIRMRTRTFFMLFFKLNYLLEVTKFTPLWASLLQIQTVRATKK